MTHTRLGRLLEKNTPLQIPGTINAYCALLAKQLGFKAIYLSGAGVANASYGLPDLGITTLDNVAEDVKRVTENCDLPLLVDIDTGFGTAFNIARCIKTMIHAGASAVHLEDQVQAKRCGHRPRKELVSKEEMVDRLKAAVDAKIDSAFAIMARTDALANEGLDAAIDRALHYLEAGADMIFLEGAKSLSDYETACKAIHAPVLANITEFGVTPLFTKDELAKAGIELILYPLSAFRAMSNAAYLTYSTILTQGSQANVINQMQTREELYQTLHYYDYEHKLDELFQQGKNK
jgi:methylisocitrate lyase